MITTMCLSRAVDRIVKKEKFNTSAEHYLREYDIALHVIFGIELYVGAGLCCRRAKELRSKR
jgi:hypothetical protein